MRVFHRTSAADAILRDGFYNGRGTYMINQEFEGVWVSDVPLDPNDGAFGDTVLSIEVPEDVLLPHEWVEQDKTYREFLVPADVLNQCGPPKREDDVDTLPDRWSRS